MDEILAYLYTDQGIALNNYRHNVGGGREGGLWPMTSPALIPGARFPAR